MAFLIYRIDNGPEQRAELEYDINTIGRHSECTITILDDMMSRKHVEIIHKDERYYVLDLGSRNGCYHNGRRVTAMRKLQDGDKLDIGKTTIIYVNAEEPRDQIKGYELHNRISKGGMGTVYKGKQVSMDRVVAIKILHEKLSSDPKFSDMFQLEAQQAGKLNHPNIIQVYDYGREDGRQFFAMEYVDGVTLRQILNKRGPLPLDEAMTIMRQVCEGLEYAHKHHIIHKDIKPENIMITQRGDVKIADLGLAQTLSQAKSQEDSDDSLIVGTPQYMAPEQATGGSLDERTDIYAVGGTFYHLITGRPPITTDESHTVMIERQETERPEDIRTVMWKHGKVPAMLGRMIMKCLEKDPDLRYTSTSKLLYDVERAQNYLTRWDPEKESYPEITPPQSTNKIPFQTIAVAVLAILAAGATVSIINNNTDTSNVPSQATYREIASMAEHSATQGKILAAMRLYDKFLSNNPNHHNFKNAQTRLWELANSYTNYMKENIKIMNANMDRGDFKAARQVAQELPDPPTDLMKVLTVKGVPDLYLRVQGNLDIMNSIEDATAQLDAKKWHTGLTIIEELKKRDKTAFEHKPVFELHKSLVDAVTDFTATTTRKAKMQGEHDPKGAIAFIAERLREGELPPADRGKLITLQDKLLANKGNDDLLNMLDTMVKESKFTDAIGAVNALLENDQDEETKKILLKEKEKLHERVASVVTSRLRSMQGKYKRKDYVGVLELIEKFRETYSLPESAMKPINDLAAQSNQQLDEQLSTVKDAIMPLAQQRNYSAAIEACNKGLVTLANSGREQHIKGLKDTIEAQWQAHKAFVKAMKPKLPKNASFDLASLNKTLNNKTFMIHDVNDEKIVFRGHVSVSIPWIEIPDAIYKELTLEFGTGE